MYQKYINSYNEIHDAIFRVMHSVDSTIPISAKRYYELSDKFYSHRRYDVHEYDVNINPHRIKYVDPNNIKLVTGRVWRPESDFLKRIGSVQSGDWDTRDPVNVPEFLTPYPKRFDEHPVFRSLFQHFENGVPWEETEYYQMMLSSTDSENFPKFRDRQEVETYFYQTLPKIYENINTDGYRTQLELNENGKSIFYFLRNEVLVDVDRNGCYQFVDNRHRLALAKILGVNKIPVVVMVRHKIWMENKHHQSTAQ